MKLFLGISLLGRLIYSSDCPLCYAPFEDGDASYKTPCGHEFHEECIGEWIVNYEKSTCPYCIQKLEVSHFKQFVATNKFNRQLALAENEDFSLDEKLTNVLNIPDKNEREIKAMRGNAIERLASQGAKCDAALHYAVKNANLALVKTFLDNGADPNVINASGDTPLMVAAQFAEPEIMKLLLEAGADPDEMNSVSKNSALTYLQAGETAAKKMYCESHQLNFFEEVEVYQEGGPKIKSEKKLVAITKKSLNFVGVVYCENNPNPWRAQRWSKRDHRTVFHGYYKDEEKAARASDTLARKLMGNGEKGHKLNFPDDDTEVYPVRSEKKKTSKFFGVTYDEKGWCAQRESKRERKWYVNGCYENEETAAQASDTLVRWLQNYSTRDCIKLAQIKACVALLRNCYM